MTEQLPSSSIVKRLQRAEGHLRSIIVMLEERRNHVEVAQQLLAVGNAITNARRALVHEHISRCLQDARPECQCPTDSCIQELQAITKYL